MAGQSPQASPSASAQACQVEVLSVGSLLPSTGDVAFLGPPGTVGVDLALSDIEAGGGVLGQPVTYAAGDSGDLGSDIAGKTVADLLARGVQAIVGPMESGVTLSVIDDVVKSGVVMVSPANSSPGLTDYPDDGLYFRVVASDAAQGRALASVVADAGLNSGASLARADAYGVGIQRAFDADVSSAGGDVAVSLTYEPSTTNFASYVSEIAATNPEFVLIAGFDEAASILREMTRQGIGPDRVQVLLTEGSVSTTAYRDLPEDAMVGVVGTRPAADPSTDPKAFHRRMLQLDPDLTTFAYGGQVYDATVLLALAAQYAGCADGASIAAAMPTVANPSPGSIACASYADCVDIISSGGTPTYRGVTGSREFNEFGDAKWATLDVIRYVSNTKYRTVEVVGPIEVPLP